MNGHHPLFSYSEISRDDVRACDLREIAMNSIVRCYDAYYRDEPMAIEIVHIPISGMVGIAWGGDAVFGPFLGTIEKTIEAYLADADWAN